MDTSQIMKFKAVLMETVKLGASDIHLSVGSVPIFRVNGQMRHLDDQDPITNDFVKALAESVLDKAKLEKLNSAREVVVSHEFDRDLRFKVNFFYQKGNLSASLRHIPAQIKPISELGFGPEVNRLSDIDNGLIIICGFFGSGRSTTAAAIVEQINISKKKLIITVEDPIDFVFSSKESIVEQREIGRDTNAFSDALKYFQEEGGDVLFLEQINNPETIPRVLQIAAGGSLVITNMIADSAIHAITSIISHFKTYDQDSIRNLLSISLRAVICQKLVPRVGGGLVAVYELLLTNDSVKATIASGNLSQLENIIQTSRQEGMVALNQNLAEAVKLGKIRPEEALLASNNTAMLKIMLKK